MGPPMGGMGGWSHPQGCNEGRLRSCPPAGGYSADTVTRSEHKVSKPLKGETGEIGVMTPRVGGQGGMGGITGKMKENCKNGEKCDDGKIPTESELMYMIYYLRMERILPF